MNPPNQWQGFQQCPSQVADLLLFLSLGFVWNGFMDSMVSSIQRVVWGTEDPSWKRRFFPGFTTGTPWPARSCAGLTPSSTETLATLSRMPSCVTGRLASRENIGW
jgi:hypothetical protein